MTINKDNLWKANNKLFGMYMMYLLMMYVTKVFVLEI